MEPATDTDTAMQASLASLMQVLGVRHEGPVTTAQVDEADNKVKLILTQLKQAAEQSGGSGGDSQKPVGKHQNVLIAGQLGIIVHQLRQAITKLGGEVTIAKDLDAAIAEYQKKDYSLVIIDLFMPTEREGMIVLEEIKRISVVCHISTQIMVLAPPSKDKNTRERCKSKGATFFLEKAEKWHELILKYYQGEAIAEAAD